MAMLTRMLLTANVSLRTSTMLFYCCPPRFSLSNIFSVADQSGGSETMRPSGKKKTLFSSQLEKINQLLILFELSNELYI